MNLEAVKDKIVVKVLIPRETITEGGIVLSEDVAKNQEPQIAGQVVSFGKEVSFDLKVGEVLLMHRSAGMDMIINKVIYKVLKDDEVYCALRDDCDEEQYDICEDEKIEDENSGGENEELSNICKEYRESFNWKYGRDCDI